MEDVSLESLVSVGSETSRPEHVADARSLAKCVQRAILRLAPGRVRELKVEVRQGRIVLQGRCCSYYCKQIAQHAAMDLAENEIVDNQIVVEPA